MVCGTHVDKTDPREVASFVQKAKDTASSQVMARSEERSPDGATAAGNILKRKLDFYRFHIQKTAQKEKLKRSTISDGTGTDANKFHTDDASKELHSIDPAGQSHSAYSSSSATSCWENKAEVQIYRRE